ncbi:MAG: ABC transporter substrate-binding protein [Rhodobacteraceae bacterium]|jgi:peptide/nickel transport system substrate-binding protein|nr:ABC transporter substrate-binding protein [Paracoccaceae bacterium]
MIPRLLPLVAALVALPVIAPAEVLLVMPQQDEPRTLSPAPSSDTGGHGPTSNIYSHLVVMDWGIVEGVAAYGDLAESWEVSDDATVYTFRLHPGVLWHDGVPLTSADVKFTYERIMAKGYTFSSFLRDVKSIETPDDLTVVITLNKPDMAFLPMMAQGAQWTGKIYPQHLWADQEGFDTGPYVNEPVGSGPFRFVRWDKGSAVVLEANPDYFRGPPAIDTLVFRTIPDANVARAEFDAGQFPYLPFNYAPPWAEAPMLEADPEINVVYTPSHFSRDLQLNLNHEALGNPLVREAIALAIDREAMNRIAFNNSWTPGYFAGVSSQAKWINETARFPDHDKARAEQLLDEAGFPRGADGFRFRVGVTGPNISDCTAITEILVQQLRDVGINAELERFDQSTWFSRIQEKNFDISCYFGRYGPDPDAYREHFSTTGARNFMSYSNAELDALAAEAVTISDEDRRREMYGRIQEIIVRDKPYINVFEEQKMSLVRPGWTGFSVMPDGFNKSISWFGVYGVVPPSP